MFSFRGRQALKGQKTISIKNETLELQIVIEKKHNFVLCTEWGLELKIIAVLKSSVFVIVNLM